MNASHILVPIDFSAGSLRALDGAVEMNQTLRARLEVVFVVETIKIANAGSMFASGKPLQLLIDRRFQMATERLADLERRYATKNVALATSLQQGNPGEAICALARKRKSDMIVMATHGATGFLQALLGSVTEHVVRAAPCPVLTVHTYVPTTTTGRRGEH